MAWSSSILRGILERLLAVPAFVIGTLQLIHDRRLVLAYSALFVAGSFGVLLLFIVVVGAPGFLRTKQRWDRGAMIVLIVFWAAVGVYFGVRKLLSLAGPKHAQMAVFAVRNAATSAYSE